MEHRYRSLRWERVALLVPPAVLLQTTVLSQFNVAGAYPDLLLALTVTFAMRVGWPAACVLGWSLGLIADLFSNAPFGMHAGLYLASGAVCAGLSGRLFADHPITQGVLVFAVVMATNVVCVFALGIYVRAGAACLVKAAAGSVLVCAAVLVMYPAVRILRGWFGGRQGLVF